MKFLKFYLTNNKKYVIIITEKGERKQMSGKAIALQEPRLLFPLKEGIK